jgi:hypothetical protein
MKTVTLELLRHGPAHNQLLSPLTQYLALCGNHPAVTVSAPFEQKQLTARLWDLGEYGYTDPDGSRKKRREQQLKDTAQIMGTILAEIPGLIAELAENAIDGDKLTHMRLILSASELALLPFELATAPNGFPGSGQALALQSQLPLCITREVRRVNNEKLPWLSKRPRILFAAASPPGIGAIPLESHLLALRKVIDPWMSHYDELDSAALRKELERHLVVLPQATVDQIQKACAGGDITHVHILAHGMAFLDAGEERFGLALHDARNAATIDVVDGVRLAALLRTPDRHGGVSGPSVVTLASCESANQGSVLGAGASVAHAIHEAGVPLVVGSQFPLSFAASVLMVEVLYEELLWGEDPRILLHDLRMQLKSRIRDTHDWASLVAYAALPSTLSRDLPETRFRQARRSIQAALNRADYAINASSARVSRRSRPEGEEEQHADQLLNQAFAQIESAREKLKPAAFPRSQLVSVYGLLASTEKKQAEILFRRSQFAANKSQAAEYRNKSTESLKRSREYYSDAFETDIAAVWAMVQYLVLTAVLDGSPLTEQHNEMSTTARFLSERNLHTEDRKEVAWARGNLIELDLLEALRPDVNVQASTERAVDQARQLNQSHERFEIYTTRRQILRYLEFFNERLPALVGTAETIWDILSAGTLDEST